MFSRFTLTPVSLALLASLSHSAQAADITLRILDQKKQPIANARVVLLNEDQQFRSNQNGVISLTNLAPGRYSIDIEAGHYGHVIREIEVGEQNDTLAITLEQRPERLVVTASPTDRTALDMSVPAQVLADDALLRVKGITIGETVQQMPGVSSSSFGPGAARPVIRGQSGARVQVLQDGLGSLDASTVSADHAVTVEPLVAEQVEVLRGPATLLYGSGAIGGVVNVIDQRIPDHAVEGLHTGAELRRQTANDERSGAIKLDGGNGMFAFHLDAYDRKTDDIEIPGEAERFPEEEEEEHEGEELAHGELPNSDSRNDGFAVGASLIGDKGFIGLSFTEFNSNYGVPGHHNHHEEEEGEEHEEEEHQEGGVRIDLKQQRTDLKARWGHPIAGIEHIKLRYGKNDYQHVELEGDEIGTQFDNQAQEGRIEIAHHPLAGFAGVFGLQWGDRDFVAIGEEAFVPPNQSETVAVFLVEEKTIGPVRFDAGVRHEQTEITVDADLPAYDRDAFSWSFGAVWSLSDAWKLAFSYTDAERHPTPEELYSEGPHIATQSFERGDVNLLTEQARNIDLGLRYQTEQHSLSLSWYRNAIDDYIFAMPTGEIEDELPVFEYVQHDAELTGFELAWDWRFVESDNGAWISHLFYDAPEGELSDGTPLPRIPASRIGLGLDWESESWLIGVEYTEVSDQDDVAAFETTTDGYSLVNAHLMYRFYTGDAVWDAFIRTSNLLDEEIRLHASFLKDIAPQPGRSYSAGIRVHF